MQTIQKSADGKTTLYPFRLAGALRGEQVIDRCGRAVETEFHYFKNANPNNQRLVAIIGSDLMSWGDDGMFFGPIQYGDDSRTSFHDLFMCEPANQHNTLAESV